MTIEEEQVFAKMRRDLDEKHNAYLEQFKDTIRLRAEKAYITESATRHIAKADDEIKKLHGIINEILVSAARIVDENFRPHIPDLTEKVVTSIKNLAPLRVGGGEK